ATTRPSSSSTSARRNAPPEYTLPPLSSIFITRYIFYKNLRFRKRPKPGQKKGSLLSCLKIIGNDEGNGNCATGEKAPGTVFQPSVVLLSRHLVFVSLKLGQS